MSDTETNQSPVPPLNEWGRIPDRSPNRASVHEENELASAVNQHRRRENLRNWLHYVTLAGIALSVLIISAGVIVYTFHLLAPSNMHWLKDPQLAQIRDFGFGVMLSLITALLMGVRRNL